MKNLVMFGGGNIGRSFVGQLFARAGYEVIFVDIVDDLVNALNAKGRYDVVIKHPDGRDEIITVENVRAIRGDDGPAVAEAVAHATLVATAVGQRGLPPALAMIARGLVQREKTQPDSPLDIIIAENLHGAAEFFRERLSHHLPKGFPLDEKVGLVETSIGKMVPIMKKEDLEKDPLWVFAEPYNSLIVAEQGFKNPLPRVDGLEPVANVRAYVDRKLFIHNLGHSATAYLGFVAKPEMDYIWQALEIPEVFEQVRHAMKESARALLAEYPDTFTMPQLEEHIGDLLSRFQNKALGDTIYRVGRDLYRKLGKHDRLIGAMLLAKKHQITTRAMAKAALAGMYFRKGDAKGKMFGDDRTFLQEEIPGGVQHVLMSVSGLSRSIPQEKAVMDEILALANQEGS